MKTLLCTLIALVCYLLLSAGSGDILWLWAREELAAAAVVSVLIGVFGSRVIHRRFSARWLNPVNWICGLAYLAGPFLYGLLMANIEVLCRIVTGRIQPAIVRIDPGLDSEGGLYLLANSITLSPGTLTLALDERQKALYIHCLNWQPADSRVQATGKVAGVFLPWVRWLARPARGRRRR